MSSDCHFKRQLFYLSCVIMLEFVVEKTLALIVSVFFDVRTFLERDNEQSNMRFVFVNCFVDVDLRS